MANSRTADVAPAQDGPVVLAEGADLLARLAELARCREALLREVVDVLAAINRAGVAEALEGLPLDLLLETDHRWTPAERSMLLAAGEMLAVMPATRRLWKDGVLSWSLVREVVALVRPLGREGRVQVDERIDASADLLAQMGAREVVWAVADAVDAVRGAAAVERAEQAEVEQRFLHLQHDLFGGARVYGQLDAVATAVVASGLDAQSTADGHADETDEPGRRGRTRAGSRADALVALCAARLDGLAGPSDAADCGHRRRAAKPLVVVHVPLDRVTTTTGGVLEVAVPNALPRLSAALVETLARDADVRAVLFDGARPLSVTAKIDAADVPADTRLAVAARDLGARDPGGSTPIPLSHVHHIRPGCHDPDELIMLSPRGHLAVLHRHGWRVGLSADGAAVWSRGGRRITRRPWGTPLRSASLAAPTPEPGGRHPR